MCRVLITGSAPMLGSVIEALHGQRTLHITDYAEQYEDFRIGRPLEGAGARSEKLLKLRAASKTLGIEGDAADMKPRAAGWARERLDELLALLESEVAAADRQKQDEEAALRELSKRHEAALPFCELPLPFEAYRPYESLAVLTGTVKAPLGDDLKGLGGRRELFQTRPDGLLALFVEKGALESAQRILAGHDFSELRAPPETGMPAEVVKKLYDQMARRRSNIASLRTQMGKARERYQNEMLACSEELGVEIEKLEAPLRFAATDSSFLIEGWIPADALDATENAIIKATGNRVHMERIEEREWLGREECRAEGAAAKDRAGAEAVGEGEDGFGCVPIALSNPGPVKPFEALTEMFSLPSYKEIDPTTLVALVFPFFFGFMIGDAGYGALLMATGVIFRIKLKKWEGFPQIGFYIIVAGFVALVLGLFLFGEAFGLPFHAPAEGTETMDWQGLTGLDVPLRGTVHKLEASGLGTLMMFSVLAGVVHLSLGNLLGAVNSWGHSRRHSMGKLGWLMVVLGFGFFLFKFGDKTAIGAWIWSGPMGALSASWDPGIGILFPYASMVLGAAGVALAVAGEGGLALMEVLGALANILSYTRIAAIGVAKAAMAFAFNILLIPLVVSGNAGYVIVGWVFLVLCHMLVFILGGLSSGIQALRLNLVEFFMKFYKGGGIKFNPFGKVRRYTVEE
jgi:V/A-type H+-transporting ATPase subunit I